MDTQTAIGQLLHVGARGMERDHSQAARYFLQVRQLGLPPNFRGCREEGAGDGNCPYHRALGKPFRRRRIQSPPP
eukprot:6032258-Pyramimonas_sp.AAC.1